MTILDFTKELIRIRSVTSDQTACKAVLERIAQLFVNLPEISMEWLEHNGIHSLAIKNFEGKWADVCLNGHVDVVPPQDETQREPQERDGCLRGRGAGDMKDGVALISFLMKELVEKRLTNKKVLLLLTADEEVGGKDGTGWCVTQGYGGDIVLIPDGGTRQEVVIGEKGVINLTLIATGKAGHSSRPWMYENALEKLFACYERIKTTIETPELYQEPYHRGCSVQLTTCHGGQATNMIPGEATGTLNIRYTEATSYERIIHRIEQILADLGGIDMTVTSHGGVLFTDPRHTITTTYLDIAKKHLGDVMFSREHGASDGRFFAEQGAIVLLHKPTCFDIHGTDERTTIADIEAIYDVYKEFICRM